MKQSRRIPLSEKNGTVQRFPSILSLPFMCAMLALAAAGLLSVSAAQADTLTTTADFDTCITSTNPNMFYGTSGATEIAAAVSPKNMIQDALFSFNTAGIVSQLNTLYGTNGWTINSVDITLYSSNPTTGNQSGNSNWATVNPGSFTLSWLSNDNWYTNQVTYNTLGAYLPGVGSNQMEAVGTYYYNADGRTPLTWTLSNNSSLLADIMAGGEVSFIGTATDSSSTVGYNFCQQSVAGKAAVLTVTADPVPIPAAVWLLAPGLMGLIGLRRKF